ncbi:MAG: trypsin-like peptidase domain-containing protein [Clostridia bacterium]|nr:trypsin-like peptidase domain-containing protein [Clostridia bacterium]
MMENNNTTSKKKDRSIAWIIVIGVFIGLVVTIAGTWAMVDALGKAIDNNPEFNPLEPETKPSQTVPILEGGYGIDPSITSIGGEDMVLEETVNPIPDIAEQAMESIGKVTVYVNEQNSTPVAKYSGTCFVVHADGFLVTNYHVIASGDSFTIRFQNEKEELEAKYVGGDPSDDIAILKIDRKGLKPLALGDIEKTRVGELAIAIGNTSGANTELDGTLTVGYISYINRRVVSNQSTKEFLQVDTPINPGNSGGPLLNSKGQVIGIVNMKSLISSYDEYGKPIDSEGIGFAIPINRVRDNIVKIIQTGNIIRPGIGIIYTEVTDEMAAQMNVPKGKLIINFMNDSPAEKAGIRVNDVIIKCNGTDIVEEDVLAEIIKNCSVGDKVTLTVLRNGQELSFEVTIGDMNRMVVLD